MRIVERLKASINSKHLITITFFASMAESTVVPIPLEAFLIPAMQAKRERLWWLAGAALAGCIAGALIGYGIGYGLFEVIGDQVIGLFGDQQQYQDAVEQMRAHGFWFVMAVGVLPIPFQLAMLAAGAIKYSLLGYITATLISRGIRYYGLAWLVWRFGDRAQALVERHKRTSAVVVTAVVAAAWGVSTLLD